MNECGFLLACAFVFVLGGILGAHCVAWMKRDACKHEWKRIRRVTFTHEGAPVGEKEVYQCTKCKEVKSVKLDGIVDDDFYRRH